MSISYIRKEFEAIADLIEKKNKDYGDAFAEATKLFRDYPASKIYEKTKRISSSARMAMPCRARGLRMRCVTASGTACCTLTIWTGWIRRETGSAVRLNWTPKREALVF